MNEIDLKTTPKGSFFSFVFFGGEEIISCTQDDEKEKWLRSLVDLELR